MSFELMLKDGHHFRYEGNQFKWQFAIKQGTFDVDDKHTVEIIEDIDDEIIVVAIYNDVLAVGSVDALTSIMMPRLRLTRYCPVCKYVEPDDG